MTGMDPRCLVTQSIQKRPDGVQQPTSFCFQRHPDQPDTGQPEMLGRSPAQVLVHEQKVGVAFESEHYSLCLPGVERLLKCPDEGLVGCGARVDPIRLVHFVGAWLTGTRYHDLVPDGFRDQQGAVELLKQVQLANTGEADQRGGIAHDRHNRPSRWSVARSSSYSAAP